MTQPPVPIIPEQPGAHRATQALMRATERGLLEYRFPVDHPEGTRYRVRVAGASGQIFGADAVELELPEADVLGFVLGVASRLGRDAIEYVLYDPGLLV
jgi:hypothetical protein